MKVKKLHPEATSLYRAYPSDSGMDLYYWEGDNTYPVILHPGHRIKLGTSLAIKLDIGTEGQIRPKSGMSNKGIMVLFGTIDNSYTGELQVVLYNFGSSDYLIEPKQKIGQLVICPVIYPDIEYVESLDDTDRGSNGFGSTGLV